MVCGFVTSFSLPPPRRRGGGERDGARSSSSRKLKPAAASRSRLISVLGEILVRCLRNFRRYGIVYNAEGETVAIGGLI